METAGIQMAARDVPDGEGHRQHRQAEGERDAEEADADARETPPPAPRCRTLRGPAKIDEHDREREGRHEEPDWRTSLPKPTPATFDPAHTYYARMVTNKGTILIKFLPEVAPMHVTSFIYLTKLGLLRRARRSTA